MLRFGTLGLFGLGTQGFRVWGQGVLLFSVWGLGISGFSLGLGLRVLLFRVDGSNAEQVTEQDTNKNFTSGPTYA